MRTGNPALQESTFLDLSTGTLVGNNQEVMTLNGTVNKTGILLLLCVITALFSWSTSLDSNNQLSSFGSIKLFIGMIGGFVLSLITIFKKNWAPVTAPLYALFQGLFLGAISASFEIRFPGIAFQAMTLTFGTLVAMLLVYRSGLIKATENFKLGIVSATFGILIVYLISMALGFFGVQVPLIHGSGIIGIGFSLLVVGVAALSLVLDFDFIEKGVQHNAPKYMEWYGAFGLMVTLVWLYIEMLRLLSKLRD